MFTNTLPARKNTLQRSYSYQTSTNPTDLHDGVLTVTETTSKRTTTRGYLIQEQTPCGFQRVFLIVKDSDEGRVDLAAGRAGIDRIGDTYECRVAGKHASCTCKAGLCGMVCVHGEALSDLVANGSIPHPLNSGCERAQPSRCSADLDAF